MTAPRFALDEWQQVVAPAAADLVAAVAAGDPADAATLTRLRRHPRAELIPVAIELVAARRKAARKFDDPERLVADVAGVEQATSARVAAHKAGRFRDLPGRAAVLDLCCGIGGDAMALAAVAEITAIDACPVRAWMAGWNAGCAATVADVTTLDVRGAVVHLDPSRRTPAGRRRHAYADYRPGPAFIADLLARCPDAAIKLGPGVDLDDLPAPDRGEVEVVNDGGTLVQAIRWSGRLARAPGARTATRLPAGASYTATPILPDDEPAGAFGAYLLVPDPALERADLVAAFAADLDVRRVHPGLGLLTAERAPGTAWLRSFTVLEQMPWRLPRLRAALRDLDAGVVEVKTRGGAIDAERAQRDLRGDGARPLTVFGLRLGRRVIAVITERTADDRP